MVEKEFTDEEIALIKNGRKALRNIEVPRNGRWAWLCLDDGTIHLVGPITSSEFIPVNQDKIRVHKLA